jgi:DNA primase
MSTGLIIFISISMTPGAGFKEVCEAAVMVRDALLERKITSYPKTTGSASIHIYPIVRGPLQKQELALRHPLAIKPSMCGSRGHMDADVL